LFARTDLTEKYIEILKKSLLNELHVELEARYRLAIRAVIENRVATLDGLYDLTPHQVLLDGLLGCKNKGGQWLPIHTESGLPAHFMRNYTECGHTMIGRHRLDNIQYCMETVLEEGIPGDMIETGIWRGGAIVLMRGILAAYNVTDRLVWAADSFAGVPPPTLAEDQGFDISAQVYPFLTVTLGQVMALISRYGLLDGRVRFLEGWFKDTLPVAPIERLSVLRLDGDLYESTMDALNPLYSKVSPGGFVIVDDYFSCAPCQQAIDTFRAMHGVTDACVRIDEQSIFWRKSAGSTGGFV
jgi:O-methyltransferase